ncbi:hypothetical protein ACJIZ3_016538 [Penstemon smallii]|uniref:J domain-containing protein n=1 Tax=Penstemon smallii TaxID=265156 RepID=A0ABD3SSZ2_9LAMI
MQADEARILLGFPPDSRPSLSQVKDAYRKRVWETHPDRFPVHEKAQAESKFKLISEAYTFLNSGKFISSIMPYSLFYNEKISSGTVNLCMFCGASASYSRVVKTGVPRPKGGQRHSRLASVPFLLIILGAFTLGGSTASRYFQLGLQKTKGGASFLQSLSTLRS